MVPPATIPAVDFDAAGSHFLFFVRGRPVSRPTRTTRKGSVMATIAQGLKKVVLLHPQARNAFPTSTNKDSHLPPDEPHERDGDSRQHPDHVDLTRT